MTADGAAAAEAGRGPGWQRPPALVAAGLALVALAVTAGLALRGGEPAPARADAVPYDGRSPREPAGRETRVIVELARPGLGEAGIADPAAQRAYGRSLKREGSALRSALAARGVRLEDVRAFTRTLNGFAATVRTADLARLASPGVRVQPVRRFYPATAEPARIPTPAAPRPAAPAGGPRVAVLDTGVDARHPLLRDRVARGFDALGGGTGAAERSGTALAGVLAAAGERVLAIRVAGAQATAGGSGAEQVALTDQLLAGLERAVDPDGDGATADRVPVALIGLNSPYAGFVGTPEARAVAGAAQLGTLVVAPAGGEGMAAGPEGTVGSPAAAPAALAVGALVAEDATARVVLRLGETDAGDAALLAGAAPPRGRRIPAVVVEAGNNPVAAAVGAAAAGARAVILAEPRARPLPAMPAGRIGVPVLGLTGEPATAALDGPRRVRLTAGRAIAAAAPRPDGPPAVSPFSSHGPAPAPRVDPDAASSGSQAAAPAGALVVKPDLVAPGAARTALAGGGGVVVGGTAIAAARVAAAAAQLARERPAASVAQLRDALRAAADPGDGDLSVRAAGAGRLRRPGRDAGLRARVAPPGGDPCTATGACARVVLANQGPAPARLALAVQADRGTRAALATPSLTLPPGGEREAEIAVAARGDLATGRLLARAAEIGTLTVPYAVPTRPPAPPPVGPLALRRRGGRVTGVAFPLGAFGRGDPVSTGTRVRLTGRLDLALVDASGRRVRRLTPATGARDLLPAEYAYTLPRGTLAGLARGRYAFRATARPPGGAPAAAARSEPFR